MFTQGIGGLQNENLPWQPAGTAITRSLLGLGSNILIDSVGTDAMIVQIPTGAGATHFDTLRFHYVIDADWHPVQTFVI
jgi:hypothetical protein